MGHLAPRVTSRTAEISQKVAAFCPHPYYLYCKRENLNRHYPTNNLGFAGKRDILANKKGYRILCLGDSTTELTVSPLENPNGQWPNLLQDELNRRLGNEFVEVINCGVSGYTSAENLNLLAHKGLDLNPDMVIVYHGFLDAWTVQMQDNYRSDYSHAREIKSWKVYLADRLPRFRFSFLYAIIRKWIYLKWAEDFVLARISTPPWAVAKSFDENNVNSFRRNTKAIASLSKAFGAKPVLVKWECDWEKNYIPPYYAGSNGEAKRALFLNYLEANTQAQKSVADEIGCLYLEVGPFDRQSFFDGIHFSESGLNQMAERLADNILHEIQLDSSNSTSP